MKRFSVVGLLTISVHTVVRAVDETQAEERALNRGVQSLCHQCASDYDHDEEKEWRTSGELDGTVEEIVAVEEFLP